VKQPPEPPSGSPNLKPGGYPIIHPVSDDDLSHMTVLELRYASRHRDSPVSTRSRFGRHVHGDRVISTPMTDSRKSKMEEIRTRIERDAYAVDPAKVADAILARLQAGQTARAADKRS
jgi:anti-sigma28 factor (negative regulator of flagellin synthesis)